MIGSRGHFGRTSGRRPHSRRGLAVIVVAAVFGCALLSCDGDPHDLSSSKRASVPGGQEAKERDASGSEVSDAVDLASVVTETLVEQQGTCFATERPPARSRLVFSLLPTQLSYLRLTVVTSPDGMRPVMVDLARGLTGGRILYATLAPSAGLVRLQTFRSASDRHPLVTDVPMEDPMAQHLLRLGERALTFKCASA